MVKPLGPDRATGLPLTKPQPGSPALFTLASGPLATVSKAALSLKASPQLQNVALAIV